MDKDRNKQAVAAWHSAERRIIFQYKNEYDAIRLNLANRFNSEKAKNYARREIVYSHYAEFRKFLSEERAKANLFTNEDSFLHTIHNLQKSQATTHEINYEIEHAARLRAKIALRQEHYTEYKEKRDFYLKASRMSNSTARIYADKYLREIYSEEYSSLLKGTRENLRDLVGDYNEQ